VLVSTPRQTAIDGQPPSGLEIGELEIAAIRQLELVAAQDLKQRHLVPHPRGAPELRLRPLLLVVEVRQHDQKAAALQPFRRTTDRPASVPPAACSQQSERGQQTTQMRRTGARRDESIAGEQADRVTLPRDDVRE